MHNFDIDIIHGEFTNSKPSNLFVGFMDKHLSKFSNKVKGKIEDIQSSDNEIGVYYALPKLNTIEYFCNLPVSGADSKYRPFTVGEQKGLLVPLEDGENKTISNTVINLVENCSSLVESKDSVRHLSNTDLEYLFLQIRN